MKKEIKFTHFNQNSRCRRITLVRDFHEMLCALAEVSTTFIVIKVNLLKNRTALRARDSLHELGVRDEKHI
jgi:hypothetical protein